MPRNRSAVEFPEGTSTVERALTVVGEILVAGGEHSLRLNDVSQRSGVSIGSLYHYFGSREGLVNAAREWMFERSMPTAMGEDVDRLINAQTYEEFVDLFDSFVAGAFSEERSTKRRRRLQMLGAAIAAPERLPGVVATYRELLDAVETFIRGAQKRGWLVDDVEPRALATLFVSVSMGPAFAELDVASLPESTWRDMLRRLLGCLLPNDKPE